MRNSPTLTREWKRKRQAVSARVRDVAPHLRRYIMGSILFSRLLVSLPGRGGAKHPTLLMEVGSGLCFFSAAKQVRASGQPCFSSVRPPARGLTPAHRLPHRLPNEEPDASTRGLTLPPDRPVATLTFLAKLTPFPIHGAEVRMTKALFCSRVRESMCVLLPKASELAVARRSRIPEAPSCLVSGWKECSSARDFLVPATPG
jgi:hypothetical protein